MTTQKYFNLSAMEIFEDVIQSSDNNKTNIKGIELIIHPHVYPSDRFRTTNFVLDSLQPLVKNSVVCDMGCGMGIVGQFALHNNAKRAVQADINPYAVKNAQANKLLHKQDEKQLSIYESNCFDNVPKQIFDLIVFNVPYHTESITFQDPLQRAFHDPGFESLKKFLSQCPDYSHDRTLITIAFSNKGDIEGIEKAFEESGLHWKLWKIINQDQAYDNRIYALSSDDAVIANI